MKLPLFMEPGEALTVLPDCIVMGSRPESVFIATPFTVDAEKPTLPKFASGRTPLRLDGASAITSADASAAPWSFPFVADRLRTASTIIASDRTIGKTLTIALLRKNAKIEVLKSVPLFEGCSKRELAQIASLADELDLPGERELTHEGSTGKEFIVLVEGEADVLRDGRLVAGIGPGDFVGEISLVTGLPRTATVKTRGPSRVLVIGAPAFRTLMRDVPTIQTRVLMAVAIRLPRD